MTVLDVAVFQFQGICGRLCHANCNTKEGLDYFKTLANNLNCVLEI